MRTEDKLFHYGMSLLAGTAALAGTVFLSMELDQPLGGLIRISSQPMLNALSRFGP
jgi:hypothetical protein